MSSEDEIQLIDKLKTLCDKNGKEIDPAESANILYKLALSYMNKLSKLSSQASPCNEMKIIFIQVATLLCATRIRNATEFSQEEIENKLKQLCFDLLKSSHAKLINFDLVNYSKSIKAKIDKWREEIQTKLKNIEKIPEHETFQNSETQRQFEKTKINKIVKLQTQITDTYRSIMAEVSQTCLMVMGSAPCRFSLVGMGSLARNQISPYSNFENIIVLEENVQKENYQQALEYFRWFAVIFQTILINLNETILPSVSIPCLNDYETKNGDWFYDAYSGRGISFDGMMPFASKSPLGRQKLTEDKPWTTELIKPISKMMEYLNREEDLKNGYHLTDILTNTCFVDGDRELYETFAKSVQEKVENSENCNEENIFEQLKDDMEMFNTKLSISSVIENKSFNIKRFFYRSTTIFISALVRLYKINTGNTFDQLKVLLERELITPEFHHKLAYAVSIACETRLKVYMEEGRQDDYIATSQQSYINGKNENVKVLVDAIGEQSCVDYLEIAYCLQYDIMVRFSLNSRFMYFHPAFLTTCIACIFNNFSRIKLVKNFLLGVPIFVENRHLAEKVENRVLVAKGKNIAKNFVVGSYYQRLKEFNKKIKQKCSTSQNLFSNIIPQQDKKYLCVNLIFLGWYLFKNAVYHEAIDILRAALHLLDNGIENENKFAEVYYLLAECERKLKNYESALKYFSKAKDSFASIQNTEDMEHSFEDCLKGEGQCLMKLERYDEAMQNFKQIIPVYEAKNMVKSILAIRWKICICYEEQGDFEQALDNVLNLNKFYDGQLNIDLNKCFKTKCIGHIGHCYTKLKIYENAEELLQNAIKYYNSADDSISQNKCKQRKADCHYDLGICYENLNQFQDGINNFHQCIDLNNELEQIDLHKYKTSIENCQRSIAFCYFQNTNLPKAIEFLELAEKTHLLLNKNKYQKSVYRQYLGEAHYDLHENEKALECFEMALNIECCLSNDPSVDKHVAYLMKKCAKCCYWLKDKKNEMHYYERMIKIELKLLNLPDISTTSKLTCYKETGLALKCLGRFQDALGYFKQYEDLFNISLRNCNSDQNADDKRNCETSSSSISLGVTQNDSHQEFIRHDELAFVLNNIGFCQNKLGFFNEATHCYKMSLQLYRNLPDNSIDVAFTLKELGVLYQKNQMFDLAINCFKEALDIYNENKYLDHSADIAFVLKNIGSCQNRLGSINEAIYYFEKSLRFYRRNLPNTSYYVAYILKNLGLLYQKDRLFNLAVSNFKEALNLYNQNKSFLDQRDDIASVLKNISLCYFSQKNFRNANNYLQRARNEYSNLMTPFPDNLYAKNIDIITEKLRQCHRNTRY